MARRECSKGAISKKYKLDFQFIKRLRICCRVIFPKFSSTPTQLFIILLGITLGEQMIIYNVGLIPSQFYDVLGAKDKEQFKSLVLFALGLIIGVAFIKSASKFVSGLLYIQWRSLLTTYLHHRYFYDTTYYKINATEDTHMDNADQRITQDIDRFCLRLSDMIAQLIISPLTITYYSYQCFKNAGYIGPVSIYIYFIIATIVNKIIMSPIVSLIVSQERCEGNFRYKHMSLRSNAESVAFLHSGRHEERKTNENLTELLNIQQKIIYYEFWLNFAINLCDYLGSILSYIVIAIPIFSGVYNNASSITLSSLISENSFVSMYLISCFSTLMDLSGKVTDMSGFTHRIGELIEYLEAYNKKCFKDKKKFEIFMNHDELNINESFPIYDLINISYSAPNSSKLLVENLNLTISAGKSLLIIGKTGSGKSSLLRILSNIWQPVAGELKCYLPLTPKEVVFLPQKTFMTNGSLKEQVTYPLQSDPDEFSLPEEEKDTEKVLKCIRDVGLYSVMERLGGIDISIDKDWSQFLSPGEMQRLSFARIFYHKPKLAVLDEPTSALGIEEEECFYMKCHHLNITLVSIGHRESLTRYHDYVLKLDGEGVWELNGIH